MLLVVELQLDLVSDLVDEDLSQQDAHQLWVRERKRMTGVGQEGQENITSLSYKLLTWLLARTTSHHPKFCLR